MAEEAAAIAFSATSKKAIFWDENAYTLLDHEGDNLDAATQRMQLEKALNTLPNLEAELIEFAQKRSEILTQDHLRVRQALGSRGQVSIKATTPVDVIGFYVLMPGL